MSHHTEMTYDVIVIGAGIAGLQSASLLGKQEQSVLVIEARDRVGGRTYSEEFEGYRWDLGGQWIGPTQFRVYQLLKQLGLEIFQQFDTGSTVAITYYQNASNTKIINDFTLNSNYQKSNHIHDPNVIVERQVYEDHIQNIKESNHHHHHHSLKQNNSSVYPEYVNQFIRKIDECALQLKNMVGSKGCCWDVLNTNYQQMPKQLLEWDKESVYSWTVKHFGFENAQKINTVQGFLATDAKEISFLFLLHYVQSAGNFSLLSDTTNGAQQDRIKGGSQQICELLAQQLLSSSNKKCHILLNSPVISIDQGTLSSENVQVTVSSGKKYFAKRIIISIPPHLASSQFIHYSPSLPYDKELLLRSFKMGSCIKCLIFYDKAFWREMNFNGLSISNHQEMAVKLTYDACVEIKGKMISRPALVAFILADGVRKWGGLPEAERKIHVLQCLSKIFDTEQALSPIHYVEKNWNSEKWSMGAYTGTLPPSIMSTVGYSLMQPFGKIHFCGTETARSWPGYMEGALESAERVVQEVCQPTTSKL